MAEPVLARSTMRTYDFATLQVLGWLAAAGGVAVGVEKSWFTGGALVLLGLVFILVGYLGNRRRIRLRRWIQDTGTGFRVIDADGERVIDDSRVLTLAHRIKENYSNGQFKSTTRTFIVWLASDAEKPERLEMVTTLAPGAPDPLYGLIQRQSERLYNQAQEDLRAGRGVLGERWSLEGGTLTIRQPAGEEECWLDEVSALNLVGDDFCLWRNDQPEAFARVPVATANAYLLSRLVNEHLAAHPKKTEAPPDGQLGRIMFERKPARGAATAAWMAATAALVMTLVFGGLFLSGQGFGTAALVCLGLTAVLSVSTLQLRRSLFRCHEFGVHQNGLMGERTVRYQDVSSFTYSATRHYHNGAYVGTFINLNFEPISNRSTERIKYQARVKNADHELDSLRDHVACVVAGRMHNQLQANGAVEWTPHLRFTKEGIEHRPSGFVGRKDPVLIPFNSITGFRVEQGAFFLWMRDQQKPVVKESVGAKNFFPGFQLLMSYSSNQ